jgi:hypothetical protein
VIRFSEQFVKYSHPKLNVNLCWEREFEFTIGFQDTLWACYCELKEYFMWRILHSWLGLGWENFIDFMLLQQHWEKAFNYWRSPGYLVWAGCTCFAPTFENFDIIGWEVLDWEAKGLVPVWKDLSLLCRIIKSFHSFDLVFFYQRLLLFVIKTKSIWILNLSLRICFNEKTCNTSEIIMLSIPVKYELINFTLCSQCIFISFKN